MPPSFDDIFAGSRVMAIFRNMDPQRCIEMAERAWSIGLRCVEVPVQSPETRQALQETVTLGAGRGYRPCRLSCSSLRRLPNRSTLNSSSPGLPTRPSTSTVSRRACFHRCSDATA
jgi:hypothetical protein